MSTPTPLVAACGLALLALATTAPPALAASGSSEPRIEVSDAKLRASLHCQRAVRNARRTPVLLVTGTGVDGSEAWPEGLQRSLTAARRPSCYVDFPEHTTADIQVSAEYLVYAIRTTARRAGRRIAIYGVSQGGLLPRWALTYWPSLRRLATDVVAVAGTQHGTTAYGDVLAACGSSCRFTAAAWQQAAGAKLQDALARYPDETPGRTAWTTVRSLDDEVVQPTHGPDPTSALRGATNIVIQRVCPGREVSHITTGVDSVSYAALIDAVTHRGPASVERFSPRVCNRAFAPLLPEQETRDRIGALIPLAAARTIAGADGGRLMGAEPPVRAYARRRR
jgi:triacylglycerol lipase